MTGHQLCLPGAIAGHGTAHALGRREVQNHRTVPMGPWPGCTYGRAMWPRPTGAARRGRPAVGLRRAPGPGEGVREASALTPGGPALCFPPAPSPRGHIQRAGGAGGRQRGLSPPPPRPHRGLPVPPGAGAPHPSPRPAPSPALGLVGRRPSRQVNAYPSAAAGPTAGLAAPQSPDGNCYGRQERGAELWRGAR